MKDRDYLWCLVHTLLDREEELDRLCPTCREQARQTRCPGCGAPMGTGESWVNPAFDEARFEAMKRGERA
ncbi:MAG: molybdopterin oxidoreductase [Clostridium sp.]|nr:molybdopterin oxidoreductase [Clostridium sp.]